MSRIYGQVLKYFIARIEFDKNGAQVSILCYKPGYGTVWSGDLKDKDIIYYETEKDAKDATQCLSGASVHGTLVDI